MKNFLKTWLQPALWLLLIALVPAMLGAVFHPRRPAWRSDEITIGAVLALGGRVVWVDARQRRDFDTAHIPSAIALNEEAWDEELPGLLDHLGPATTVVVYCSSLSCQTSHEVARRLRDDVGLEPVLVLQGGWEAWQAEGPKQ